MAPSRRAITSRRSGKCGKTGDQFDTVMKAYRELETKGLAVGRPGQGTFTEAALIASVLQDFRDPVGLPPQRGGGVRGHSGDACLI